MDQVSLAEFSMSMPTAVGLTVTTPVVGLVVMTVGAPDSCTASRNKALAYNDRSRVTSPLTLSSQPSYVARPSCTYTFAPFTYVDARSMSKYAACTSKLRAL